MEYMRYEHSLRKKTREGYTLPETLMTVATFLLLSLTLLGMLITGLRYFQRLEAGITAQQKVAMALEIITSEIRQGIPCTHSSVGYCTISPSVTSTAILTPNYNSKTSTELVFNIPNYDGDGSGSAWDPFNVADIFQKAEYFKKIRYYISGGKSLHRQVTTYNSSGAADSANDYNVIEAEHPNGSVSLNCTWITPELVQVKVTVNEGFRDYSAHTKAYVMVKN